MTLVEHHVTVLVLRKVVLLYTDHVVRRQNYVRTAVREALKMPSTFLLLAYHHQNSEHWCPFRYLLLPLRKGRLWHYD